MAISQQYPIQTQRIRRHLLWHLIWQRRLTLTLFWQLTQMQTALNGVSASTDQLTTLLDASTQIQNGIAQLDAGAAQLDEQVSYDAYKAILKENGLDLDQLKDGNAKAMEQLEQLARVMPQLKDVILLLKLSLIHI